jgi:hypothetical protein
MAEDHKAEIEQLKEQRRSDRKLIGRAAQVLAEIDRGPGLSDEHAEVLIALRIRLEGKERAKLEDLMAVSGEVKGQKDLGDLMGEPEEGKSDWPVVEEKKRDWPGL